MRWLRTARFWLGVIAGLAALHLAGRGVPWVRVSAALSQADYLLLLLALGSVLLTNWAKAMRWRLLFYPRHSLLSVRSCLFGVLIGQLANNLLPARLGELVRAYLIGESSTISKVFALATTVVEKALDSVMLLLLVALLSLWMPMPPWLRRSSLTISGVLVVLLLGVILLASQHKRIGGVLDGWIEKHPALAFLRIFGRLVEASGELSALRNAQVELQLWGWSVLIWMLAVATNALIQRAVHLDVSPLASPLLLVVLMAGTILPTSPMQIGVFHYLCVLTLTLFGVGQDVALSYAFLLHLVVYLPIIVGGVLGPWVQGFEPGELAMATRSSEND